MESTRAYLLVAVLSLQTMACGAPSDPTGSGGGGGEGGSGGGGQSGTGGGGQSGTGGGGQGGSGGGSSGNDDFAVRINGQLNCFGTPSTISVGQNCTGTLSISIKKGIAESVTVSGQGPDGIDVFFGYGQSAVKDVKLDLLATSGSVGTSLEIRVRGVAAAGPARVIIKAVSTSHGTLEFPIDLTVLSRAGFKLVDISSSNDVTCGVDAAGDAWCWGSNQQGALGDGTTTSSILPVKVSGNHRFTSVHASASAVCGVDTDRKLWCWGSESPTGAFGAGTNVPRPAKVPVAGLGGRVFEKVSFGGVTGCGLTATGEAWCWGGTGSSNVLVGNGLFGGSPTPVQVSGGLTFKDISGGAGHACGVTTGGVVYCWGYNNGRALGDGTTVSERRAPVAINSPLLFESVSVGYALTCAVTNAGDAWCWGLNSSGQLGSDSTAQDSNTPVAVSGGIKFKSVTAAQNGGGACGIDVSNAVHCWGGSEVREAGISSTSRVPKAIPGKLTFSKVSAGGFVSCGIATNGLQAAYCWSNSNVNGYLGTGDKRAYYGPVPLVRPDGT